MWIQRAIYENLVKQAAQSESLVKALQSAEKRAEDAESALASERSNKDWMISQLTSRFLTKQKSYGLDNEPPKIEPESHPKGYTHDPTTIDLAKLEYYKQCAVQAGKDEEDGVMRWEAEMRGEGLSIEMDTEN